MPVKEFREFFLRNTPVTGGLKPDKQVPYPTTYTVSTPSGGSVNVYNRFKKGNYPSEDVFAKLFESITFKLNKEDTRTASIQGLSKLAAGRLSVNFSKNDADNFNIGVSPIHLPEVIAGSNVTVDVVYYNATTNTEETTLTNIPVNNQDDWRTRYRINGSSGGGSTTPVPEIATHYIDSIADIKTGNTSTPSFSVQGPVFNPLNVLIPKDQLKTNGDYLEFELLYDTTSGGSGINPICPYLFHLTFGTNLNGLNNSLVKTFVLFDYQDQNLHENANTKAIKISCKLYKKNNNFVLTFTYELDCDGYAPSIGLIGYATLKMENNSVTNNFTTDNYLGFCFEPIGGAANGSHSAPVVIVKSYKTWV